MNGRTSIMSLYGIWMVTNVWNIDEKYIISNSLYSLNVFFSFESFYVFLCYHYIMTNNGRRTIYQNFHFFFLSIFVQSLQSSWSKFNWANPKSWWYKYAIKRKLNLMFWSRYQPGLRCTVLKPAIQILC